MNYFKYFITIFKVLLSLGQSFAKFPWLGACYIDYAGFRRHSYNIIIPDLCVSAGIPMPSALLGDNLGSPVTPTAYDRVAAFELWRLSCLCSLSHHWKAHLASHGF